MHAWWVSRRGQVMGLLLAAMLLLGSRAQAAIIYTVDAGTTPTLTNFPTIAAALAAVPSPLTDSYELRLLDASYTENVLLTKTGSAVNTLTIKPGAGVSPVIIGTLTFGAGSAYNKLDGNNGTVLRALKLEQPNTALPTVLFTADASNNEIRSVEVLGSNTLTSSGVIVLGNGTVSGNDNNTITQSFVGNLDPIQLPTNLVYAANSGGGANDNFSLTNNQLFNFTRTGVLVGVGNGNEWIISGNSLYYNAVSVPTTAQTGVDFRPGAGANAATISGNFIGGRADKATGGIWTNTGNQDFQGVVVSCGNSVSQTNKLIGNTVSQINLPSSGGQAFTALNIIAGRSELTGNVVTNVSNTGAGAVNSLVSQATTILKGFSVSTSQLMVVANGLTTVEGNLNIATAGKVNLTGGNMLVKGNFISTGGLFTQTLGDIEITGDMLNSGSFVCTTGKVRLTGAGAQKVSGGIYFNLEVDGGGTKTLTGNILVFNGVQMINGILDTRESSPSAPSIGWTLELAELATLSETDNNYVLGRVAAFREPKAGLIEDFGGMGLLLQPAAGSTLPGKTRVERTTGDAPKGVGGRTGILRYFDISSENPTGLNIAMTINYLPHELNGIAPANLIFFQSINNGASWQNKNISSSGANFAKLNKVTEFGRWTLGDIAKPLPVGLTAFKAERQGRNAFLTWSTATEQDNRGFGIEVSLDGKTFKEIGFVAAEGNSSTPRSYSFVDVTEGKTGARYYRLRQDDRSGPSHYFSPQKLTFDGVPATLAAYPTQFGADLTVALNHPTATTATLRLLDGMGREVWRQEQALVPGAAPLHVHPTCAAGSYIFTATIDGQVLRQRVVRE
ncbi:autotransporter outer membrane beta-barrel domain-containing protein [Hymenobacter terrenus]|uniref:hypothetical protein n=1 Tax=Hymenobacter terrenus TaxID=1629124 RepID=UPI0018CF2FE4|nr:hypothetical protein [Hymenobacter terrenus]